MAHLGVGRKTAIARGDPPHATFNATIMTSRSNMRWCSGVPEFTCWNGDVVRVAFALDGHDREVVSRVATIAGISGEMVMDMMVPVC